MGQHVIGGLGDAPKDIIFLKKHNFEIHDNSLSFIGNPASYMGEYFKFNNIVSRQVPKIREPNILFRT